MGMHGAGVEPETGELELSGWPRAREEGETRPSRGPGRPWGAEKET